MLDGSTMLRNIIDGNTALGAPFAYETGDPKVFFMQDHAIRVATVAALELAARIYGMLDEKLDGDFTRFARKLLFNIRRGGTLERNPSFLTRVEIAARYVTLNPGLVYTCIGFPAIVSMALNDQARRARISRDEKSSEDQIAVMAFKVQPPAPSKVWEHPHGQYQLYEFSHPFHVWEEGMVLGNCLCCLDPAYGETRIHGDDDPVQLWELTYWHDVAHMGCSIFSLRSGTARIALLLLREGKLIEFSVGYPNEPQLWEIIADVTEYLEARNGTFEVAVTGKYATIDIIIDNIRYGRTQRLKRAAHPRGEA